MANTDAKFGARPVRHLDGSPFNGAVNRYHIASTYETAMYIGDFVISSGSAHTDGTPQIEQAIGSEGTPSAALLGVVVGFEPLPTDINTQYHKVDTAQYALVADAPDLVFHIQADDVGAEFAATDMGNNCDIIVAAGSTTTGLSGMEIDTESKNTTSAHLRVLRPAMIPGNTPFDTNAIYEVVINEHEHKSTTGT